jgi:SAM-dependent methyltransferase
MNTNFCQNQFEYAYPDGIEHHWWQLARNSTVAHAIRKFAGPDAAVLDVGCGRGIAVKYLRDRGIDCTGVERAEALPISGAEQYIRVGVDVADLPKIDRQRYDTILLLDVIEHIPDPAAFLGNLADAFPNLRHIILTVPARQELWSNYDEFYGHFRRYTMKTVNDLAGQLGWKLTWQGYLFRLVYPIAWGLAKLGKRETKLTAPIRVTKWLHKVISYVMILDYHLLPSHIGGTSILACFCPTKTVS